jgi:diguanylate cyclase
VRLAGPCHPGGAVDYFRENMGEAVHNILVVEDSEDDAVLLEAELRKLKRPLRFRRVDCAEDMQAALAEQRFDLVISDHHMPRFDSHKAFDVLQRSRQQIPFVIMSGAMPEEMAAAAVRLGAEDFIDKSNRARLLPVVERGLRHSRLLKAKEHIERSLVRLTYRDSLTDLPNGHMLAKLIEQALREPRDAAGYSALVMLDIDRFVRINESLGHEHGDHLLREVGERLLKAFSMHAMVARMGQDKFALYFQHVVSNDDALVRAQSINRIFAAPFMLAGEEIFMTCAMGVGLCPDDASDAAGLVQRAESAMHEAKKLGPGAVLRYAGAPARCTTDALRLESALRHAVERDELLLHFQPCVDTLSGALMGTEALVRWRPRRGPVLGPDEFIPLADETGLILEIGRWVLQRACQQNRTWQLAGKSNLVVAINVSAVQFHQAHFAQNVAEVIAETGIAPETLELEITETAVMRDAEATIGTLRTLKNMGVRLSVDDFGTGYSSLSYLKRFPIDVLKIDRSFLIGVHQDSDNQAIVRTIIALAKTLKLSVVAEGVETIEQLEFLRTLGCHRVQGFLIGRPVTPAAMMSTFMAPTVAVS